MRYVRTVLASESELDDQQRLLRLLGGLGLKVHAADTATAAIDILRREIPDAAVVATELTLDEEPLVSVLSRVPSILVLVAIGPGGNWDLEQRARLAGVDAYLARPVDPASLAAALWMPAGQLAPVGHAPGEKTYLGTKRR